MSFSDRLYLRQCQDCRESYEDSVMVERFTEVRLISISIQCSPSFTVLTLSREVSLSIA